MVVGLEAPMVGTVSDDGKAWPEEWNPNPGCGHQRAQQTRIGGGFLSTPTTGDISRLREAYETLRADHRILLHRVELIEHHLDSIDGGAWQFHDA